MRAIVPEIKVYPHRLRQTCAPQLLNAGCRITSLQRFLSHKKLNITMIQAHVLDPTLAEDCFKAMERVEQRLEFISGPKEGQEIQGEIVKVPGWRSAAARRQARARARRVSPAEICIDPQEQREEQIMEAAYQENMDG